MRERERERDANDEETAAPHPPLKVRGSRGETGGGVGISKRERERERECPRVVVAEKKRCVEYADAQLERSCICLPLRWIFTLPHRVRETLSIIVDLREHVGDLRFPLFRAHRGHLQVMIESTSLDTQ